MQNSRSSLAVRLLPSMTDFAFLMPIAFLFGRMDGAKTLLGDCDTGWHIRTGEWIVHNHQVPAVDVFSFSKAGEPWFAWEWLSDILFAWLNHHGGLATVVLFSVVMLAVTFLLLFRMALRRANPIVAVIITMVAAASSAIHWLARPHLFTLLFLVLFYRVLENVREGRTRLLGVPYLVILPVAMVLWTNLHGGFIVGILLLGAYAVGDLLKMALSPDAGQALAARLRARAFLLSTLGCVAASLINPYFYHLHVHVVKYLFDPFQAQHIVEFLTLNFHHPVAIFFETLLVLGAGAAIWHGARGSYTEAVLVLMWGHAALLASRNIPLYGIISAPIVAVAVDAWLKKVPSLELAPWLRNAARKYSALAAEVAEIDGLARWHVVSFATVVVIAALLYAPNPPKRFRPEYDPKAYPAGAVAVLRNEPAARIFTNDEWGDYLIYQLYPGHRVFVDGRSDFYGDDFVQRYLDVMSVKYDWQKTLDGFGINTILLPTDAPLAGALKESARWRVVYDDGISLIFQPSQKAGAAVPRVTSNPGGGGTHGVAQSRLQYPAGPANFKS